MQCGSRLHLPNSALVSTSCCLVRFKGETGDFLLGAGHGLVSRTAAPGDLIDAAGGPAGIGRLSTWTTFYDAITADAALVRVKTGSVDPRIGALGLLRDGTAATPAPGDVLRIVGLAGGQVRQGTVARTGVDVPLPVTGPGWILPEIVYRNQIVCRPMFTEGGDSGALAIDSDGRAVGMVIGGRGYVKEGDDVFSETIITPIAAILNHRDFDAPLEIVAR